MKETKKLHKKLLKKVFKNKSKLINLCENYAQDPDTDLLQDIIYYAEMVFDDEQAILLMECCANDFGVELNE